MLKKPKRIVNKQAIENARKLNCEYCYKFGNIEVHHITSRGAGGHDVSANLISLCRDCHSKAHTGQIGRQELRDIALQRETPHGHYSN